MFEMYNTDKVDNQTLFFSHFRTPLYVNFEERTNKVGITQPSCVGCSNCCSGCNIGAKNTLDMNYLPDAKAHGAHIFTRVSDRA